MSEADKRRAEEIVYLIGNIANRQDLATIQKVQVAQIVAAIVEARLSGRAEGMAVRDSFSPTPPPFPPDPATVGGV